MMWRGSPPSSRCLLRFGHGQRRNWRHAGRLFFVLALLTILSACSSVNWEERTAPTRPVLSSMTRATLNGVKGVWMDERDAGALALWLEEVSP